jgi:hypothetical protein
LGKKQINAKMGDMLRAIPKSWFSWDYSIVDGSIHVAEMDLSLWREKGQIIIGDEVYAVSREGLAHGAFIMDSGGTVLARAVKPSALRRLFTVEHQDKQYTLAPASALGRKFVLMDGPKELGSITPQGFLTQRARVDLPEHLSLPFRIFIIWLTMIMWKRDAEAASD